ncbi:MAG: SoxR reducing system RseC family protein [Firmicutes bacterium]|nr:SoxR reducing system RseC family protein [Bacillota bacterium]
MEEIATVIKTKDDKAEVKIVRHSACSKCKKKCSLAESHEQDELIVEVKNDVGVKKGDRVVLEMEERNVLFASLIVYLLPLVAMIIGYFVGNWAGLKLALQSGEGAGIIGTLLFLILSFLLIHLINPFLEKKTGFQPKIKKNI